MIYSKPPKNWKPKFIVVCCIVEFDGKILLLKRLPSKLEGNKWGFPSGKKDKGETNIQTIIRELKEETDLNVKSEDLELFKTYYMEHPWFNLDYPVHILKLSKNPDIIINSKEHTEYKWVTPKEAISQNLVKDNNVILEDYYGL